MKWPGPVPEGIVEPDHVSLDDFATNLLRCHTGCNKVLPVPST